MQKSAKPREQDLTVDHDRLHKSKEGGGGGGRGLILRNIDHRNVDQDVYRIRFRKVQRAWWGPLYIFKSLLVIPNNRRAAWSLI